MDRRYLLFLTKALRGFVYGVFSVIIFIYLIDNNISAPYAGLIVTLSIVLNSLVTFYITSNYGDGYSKEILIIFSILLAIGTTGLVLVQGGLFKALFSIIGALGVNPSDNTIFASYEQPLISKIIEKQHRKNIIFSYYTLSGYIASSIGAASLYFGLNYSLQISVIFSILTIMLYFFIPRIEGRKRIIKEQIKEKSKKTARDVSLLFSMDAVGGGFVLQSLIALWFKIRYHLNVSQLGLIFFVVDIIIAVSILITPAISKRIGLIRTMVYSHLPSNIFLIMIPIFPNVYVSLLFLFLRQSLSQMDVPTRQSYLNSVVDKDDRSYVVGVSNASRSIAQSSTPYISSYLISFAASAVPFIAGGSIKIAYDLLLFNRFRRENEKYD